MTPLVLILMLKGMLSFARADDGKYALILGGGGDPPGPSTMFDESTRTFADQLKKGKYSSLVAYDGGHAQSQAQIAKDFPGGSTPFTPANADGLIKKLEAKINSGQAKQVMIVIDSHGVRDGPPGSHAVSTSDPKNPQYDLAQLDRLQELAGRRGVKLAILDMSCYSGQTVAHAGRFPKTCVISATSAETVAVSDFTKSLAQRLKPNQSLEAAFTDARNSVAGGWPQISGPAGRAAETALSDLRRVSAFTGDAAAADQEQTADVRCASGERSRLRLMYSLAARAPAIDPKVRAKYLKTVQAYDLARQNAVTGLQLSSRNVVIPAAKTTMSQAQLVNLDSFLDTTRTYAATMPDGPDKEGFKRLLASEGSLRQARAQLLKGVDNAEQVVRDQALNEKKMQSLGYLLSGEERQIYDSVYRAGAKPNPRTEAFDGGAACRDFKF